MTKKQIETAEGQVVERFETLFFQCNRPMSFVEYQNLVAKVQMEEERVGRKIIILPHAVDVVKS